MRCAAAICTAGFALVFGVSNGTKAGECDDLSTSHAVATGLESEDSVICLRAKACGLASDDPASRSLVIQKYLSANPVLNIHVKNLPGDNKAAEYLRKMPPFSVTGLKWDADGHSYSGDRLASGVIEGLRLGGMPEDEAAAPGPAA